MDEDQAPSHIVPLGRRKTAGDRLRSAKDMFFTRKGLLGDYDYAFLFRPNLPFMKASRLSSPFFGLNDPMPVVLALLLGFQHSLSMLAGIISPPLIMAGAGGANLTQEQEQYLVSTALIVSGILSLVQITRFHIYTTSYASTPPHARPGCSACHDDQQQRQVLSRNGPDLRRRHLLCHHPRRHGRLQADVRQRLLPDRCRWHAAAVSW